MSLPELPESSFPKHFADMDVDNMKKTSTRLIATGGFVVLGACAVALAQHDARNRERQPLPTASSSAEQAKPIGVQDDWDFPTGRSADLSTPESNSLAHRMALKETDAAGANPLRGLSAGFPDAGLPGIVEDSSETKMVAKRSLGDLPDDDFPPTSLTDALPSRDSLAGIPESGLPGPDLSATRSAGPSPNALADNRPHANADYADYMSDDEAYPAQLVSGTEPAAPPAWLNDTPLPGATGQGASNSDARSLTAPNQGLAGQGLGGSGLGGQGFGDMPIPELPTSGNGINRDAGVARPQMPTPSLPSSPATAQSRPNAGTPLGSGFPAQPSRNPVSQVGDLSDTQRGVMSPTELGAGQSNQRVGGAANSRAPAYGQSGGSAGPGAAPNQIPSLPANPAYGSTVFAPQTGVGGPQSTSSSAFPQSLDSGGQPGGAMRPQQGATNQPMGNQVGAGRPSGALASLVSNQPGNRYLDGSQNPIMLIQKRAPEEIQVGKPATFVIAVRNAGNSTAHEVTVADSVPRGSRFVESVPAARPTAQGILNWNLGEIGAGEERTITLKIVPEVQGEVGSVATVHFAAQASVRTVATLPKLELQLRSEPDVLIGNVQTVSVLVKNTGTGVARGVRLEADIPGQLTHESGDAQLEAVLGDLRPSESRPMTLSLTAVQPGASVLAVRAISEDGLSAEESVNVAVQSPQFAASIRGPKLRYLERQATYQVELQNTGTAPATNVELAVRLPAGLKFNSANNRGSYDPNTHSVGWWLEELPAGRPAVVEVAVLPVDLGPQIITFAAKADLDISTETQSQVMVDGLAELAFTIGQDNGTIETGASSTYSVQITNVGNKPDKNVQLAVELPPGTQLLAVDAPVEYRANGSQIVFAPVAEMKNRDQYTYRFQVQHNQAGKQIVRTKLTSANWPTAVVKEEGTLVYNDQN